MFRYAARVYLVGLADRGNLPPLLLPMLHHSFFRMQAFPWQRSKDFLTGS